MNRAQLITSVLAVALLSLSLGLMGGFYVAHQGPFALRGWPGMPHRMGQPGTRPHDPLPRLARALELTPEQIDHLRPKLEATRQKFEALRDSVRSVIEAELTPAQRERWQKLQDADHFHALSRGPWRRPHEPLPGTEGEPK